MLAGIDVLVLQFIKVSLLVLAAFVVFKLGVALMPKYLRQDKEKAEEDVKNPLQLIAPNLFMYVLILFVTVGTLLIFEVNLLETGQLRQGAGVILKALGIIVLARITLHLGRGLIDNFLFKSGKTLSLVQESRRKTLSGLLKSILLYVVYFITGTMLLENFGVRTASILAGVGVLGLAVSFGAQNLIRDIIAGFFIIFEGLYNVGEFVMIADVTGTVEEVGLRTTKVKEWTGQLHTIPNGEVGKVANYSRGAMLSLVTVSIAYEEDIDKALEVLHAAGLQAREELEDVLEEPIVQGVTELGDSHVAIRTVISATPGEQWAVEREMRKRFKQALDAAGIEIPYPRRVIIDKSRGKDNEIK